MTGLIADGTTIACADKQATPAKTSSGPEITRRRRSWIWRDISSWDTQRNHINGEGSMTAARSRRPSSRLPCSCSDLAWDECRRMSHRLKGSSDSKHPLLRSGAPWSRCRKTWMRSKRIWARSSKPKISWLLYRRLVGMPLKKRVNPYETSFLEWANSSHPWPIHVSVAPHTLMALSSFFRKRPAAYRGHAANCLVQRNIMYRPKSQDQSRCPIETFHATPEPQFVRCRTRRSGGA